MERGGLCPGRYLSRGSLFWGSLSGEGLCAGGFCVQGDPTGYGKEWAVCILLECILVLCHIFKLEI